MTGAGSSILEVNAHEALSAAAACFGALTIVHAVDGVSLVDRTMARHLAWSANPVAASPPSAGFF